MVLEFADIANMDKGFYSWVLDQIVAAVESTALALLTCIPIRRQLLFDLATFYRLMGH
jgi:hypothetical protein